MVNIIQLTLTKKNDIIQNIKKEILNPKNEKR